MPGVHRQPGSMGLEVLEKVTWAAGREVPGEDGPGCSLSGVSPAPAPGPVEKGWPRWVPGGSSLTNKHRIYSGRWCAAPAASHAG